MTLDKHPVRHAEPRSPLHVVFLSSHDPLDVGAFSSTIFYMARALEAVFPDLEIIRATRPPWFHRFQKAIRWATRGRGDPFYWPVFNRSFARRLARRWRGQRVLAIAAVASPLAGELAEYVPVLSVSDATFVLMRNFYEHFARYGPRTAAWVEEGERRTIVRAVHNSFSSRWAADSAVDHYGATREDVSAVSWGCNLDEVPIAQARLAGGPRESCRLLFLGVDWQRKGGDVVVAAAEMLAARGARVDVDLVGARPPEGLDAPWIHNHGFLSKADPKQFERLRALLRDADFLFLPTRQDCTPMVFSEANAYGTPVVTRAVGGVADVVRDGVNGIVLPEDAGPSSFADAIAAAWGDPDRYRDLRDGARKTYDGRLNWAKWAEAIAAIIRDLEARGRV